MSFILKEQIKCDKEEKPYKCLVCNASFAKMEQIAAHTKSSHENNFKPKQLQAMEVKVIKSNSHDVIFNNNNPEYVVSKLEKETSTDDHGIQIVFESSKASQEKNSSLILESVSLPKQETLKNVFDDKKAENISDVVPLQPKGTIENPVHERRNKRKDILVPRKEIITIKTNTKLLSK